MKRILVGVDGSAISNSAAGFAASLARATGAELQLAYAIEPPVMLYGSDATGEVVVQQYEGARELARATLADAAAALEGRGIAIATVAVEGLACDVLAELAKGEIDLVVVGHRSRNAIARAMLGSVADRLVQICPRPVVVFR